MVIQRWQSVLLLVTAAVMAVFTFMSLGQMQLTDYSLNFTTLGYWIEGESVNGAPSGIYMRTWPFFIVSLMSFVIPLIAIFTFRNLPLQKKLCLIELLFLAATICIGIGYGYYGIENGEVSWSSLIVAPFLGIIADMMAYSRISADQRKLRDSDRLR